MNHAESRLAPREKLATHPQFAAYLAGQSIYPIGIEASPSGICQAECPFCFYAGTGQLGHHRNVMLKAERALEFLREAKELGVKSVSWTGGGEPTLHPEFPRLVEYASYLLLDQGLFTNALAGPKYDPSLFAWIRVTMTDKPYREDVISKLRPAKTLGFAFNYSGAQDDDYLRTTLDLAERVKADYVQVRPALAFHGQTVDIKPPAFAHPLMHVTGYKFDDARHKHGYATCEAYHFSPFLWEDGNLDVCAYQRKHDGYRLGNIYDESLKSILDRAPKSVPVAPFCQVACKLHEMNKAVHAARALEDVNFP